MTLNVKIDLKPLTADRLKALADRQHMTLDAVVKMAVMLYLAEKGGP